MSRARTTTDLPNGQNVCGQRVRQRRDALGLSQDELAAKGQLLGWSATRGLIAKIESGERSVSDDELRHLAFLLDSSIEELLDWVNFKEKKARKLQNLKSSVNST